MGQNPSCCRWLKPKPRPYHPLESGSLRVDTRGVMAEHAGIIHFSLLVFWGTLGNESSIGYDCGGEATSRLP